MIVRKRSNRPDSQIDSLCSTVDTLTSGYVSTRTNGPKTTQFQYLRHISHHIFEDCEGDTSNTEARKCKNLEPRLSIGRTCMSITNYVNKDFDAHRSSQTISSWILMNNMSKLKTAYKYLTPIIDDIISRATSYTHKEFKDLLSKSKPICSISYTQYIRAYQASEIINQVGKELSSMHQSLPYQNNFVVNTVATIKREELLENIERMADRIFIDRDLMKQLVDLHELITDTIRKLKTSLDQVSIEGMPRLDNDLGNSNSMDSDKSVYIDKSMIRNEIAENFIVVGEPKNRCCYFQNTQTEGDLHEYDEISKVSVDDKIVAVTLPPVDYAVAHVVDDETKAPDSVSVSENNAKPGKSPKSRRIKKKKLKTVTDTTVTAQTAQFTNSENVAKHETPYENLPENDGKECWRPPMENDKCPDIICGATIDPHKMSAKELEMLVQKRASYTVGLRQYQLKCDEDIGKACAVLPTDFKFEERPSQAITTNLYDSDSRPVVIAESDTDEMIAASPPTPAAEPVIHASKITHDGKCVEDCKAMGKAACSEELQALRHMFHKIAEQIDDLKNNNFVFFDDLPFTESEYISLTNEHRTTQEIMYCLKELENIQEKLYRINFMEVEAEKPDPNVGCCYKEYLHVHTKIIGLPISVKITDSTLEAVFTNLSRLTGGAVQPVKPVKPGQTVPVPMPTTSNKSCGCKPVTIGSLLKEKCAITKMLKSKHNELRNKNKVVMMNVDPLYDPYKSAFQEREPDVFEVMDMQDSNTSLPYVVQRHSLPNVNICPALPVSVPQLKQRLRTTNIDHPNPRIERHLKSIGLDNLIKASLPAKCCLPAVINGDEDDAEPFRASLNSLPLTTSDIQLITDIAEEEDYRFAICKYRPINYFTASIKFKFECYTNFQENFASNYDYFIPKTRVYQIFYFEIFKKDNNSNTNAVNMASTRADVSRRHNSSSSSSTHNHHYPHNHRRQHNHENDTHYRSTNNQGRHPSKSVIGEFFRRLIFNTEHSEEEMDAVDYSEEDNSIVHRRKESKYRRERSKERSERGKVETRKKVKNRRLQANSFELDRCYQQEPTIIEVSEENEDSINDPYKYNTISSSMKNYTVSRITTNKTKYPRVKPRVPMKLSISKDIKSRSTRTHSTMNSTIHYESRDVKVGPSEPNIPKIGHNYTHITENGSDVSLTPENYAEPIEGVYDMEQKGLMRANSKLNSNMSISNQMKNVLGRQKEKNNNSLDKIKPSTEVSSSKNLGTIYETDEKLCVKDPIEHHVPYKSFYEFLRSPELSKSFTKVISSEQAIDSFEKNKIGPEQFWSMYFKARRAAHRNASKSFSITSTEDTEMRMHELENMAKSKTKKPFRKMRSKIPKRIHVPFSESSSDMSLSTFSFDSKLKKKLTGSHAKEVLTTTSTPIPPSPSKLQDELKKSKDHHNKTKIYFKEILDEAVNRHTNEIVSMQSLQVLASKNGPGYITVLHPICGCPEVSIFIPCYCHEEGCQKHSALSPKRVAMLTGAKDGRHIILPASCRIPKITETNNLDKTEPQKRKKHNVHNSDSNA